MAFTLRKLPTAIVKLTNSVRRNIFQRESCNRRLMERNIIARYIDVAGIRPRFINPSSVALGHGPNKQHMGLYINVFSSVCSSCTTVFCFCLFFFTLKNFPRHFSVMLSFVGVLVCLFVRSFKISPPSPSFQPGEPFQVSLFHLQKINES